MTRPLFNSLTGMLARIPLPVGYALAAGLGRLHYWCFPQRRRRALANLELMLPGRTDAERRRTARAMMTSYVRMLVEFFRLPRLSTRELLDSIEIVGHENVVAALAQGKGLILTSCHVGNWELGAVVLARLGHAVNAVSGVQFGRWLSTEVRDAKQALSVATIAPEDGFRKIWRALARNEIVALMVDGDLYSAGATCCFFGRTTTWPSGPGSLALRTGAPVVAGYCERLSAGGFRMQLEPALLPTSFDTANEINQAIAAITERHIADHMDQWCIYRSLWPAGRTTEEESGASVARAPAS